MAKLKTFIILVFVVGAFGTGVYFKDDAIKFYNSFGKQVKTVQTQIQNLPDTDIGSVVSKASKEILAPTPLNIGKLHGAYPEQAVLLQSKIISETNLQRQQNGNLPALKENAKLDNAAAAKANDMFKNQYFEHVSPTGVGPGKLVQNYGYDYILAGENLILGNFSSEKEVVENWMASPGHRENILNNRYTEIGVAIIKGIYKGQNVWIGVQEFGLPLSSCIQPDVSLENEINSDKTQLDELSSEIDVKKNQIDNTNPNSSAYSQMINDFNQLVEQYNSLAETTKNIVAQYNNQVNIFNNCVAGK